MVTLVLPRGQWDIITAQPYFPATNLTHYCVWACWKWPASSKYRVPANIMIIALSLRWYELNASPGNDGPTGDSTLRVNFTYIFMRRMTGFEEQNNPIYIEQGCAGYAWWVLSSYRLNRSPKFRSMTWHSHCLWACFNVMQLIWSPLINLWSGSLTRMPL